MQFIVTEVSQYQLFLIKGKLISQVCYSLEIFSD